jgi:hypothetical protein
LLEVLQQRPLQFVQHPRQLRIGLGWLDRRLLVPDRMAARGQSAGIDPPNPGARGSRSVR